MRTFALLIMSFLAFSAYGSRPIMGDEALACISGGMPSKVGEMHGVSFNNGYELDALRPGTFASAAVLKSAKQHSATFMVDGLITQTINLRKLPRQAHNAKVELSSYCWRTSAGVRSPRESCGRSSLYSSIHHQAASRTSSRRRKRYWSSTSSRNVRLNRSM